VGQGQGLPRDGRSRVDVKFIFERIGYPTIFIARERVVVGEV
jgi:hypothetical protein